MTLPKNRRSEIDLVKTIAIVSVVMIHILTLGRYHDARTLPWFSVLFWRCASSAAVPLFFMSNGALLLDPKKELSLKKLLTVRLPSLLVPLFFWALAYMGLDLIVQNKLTLSNILSGMGDILLFRHKNHLYFLHIMLLVYVFLPITRFFLSKAGRNMIRYLMVLWFALGILYPTLSRFWPLDLVSGIPDQWALNLTYCAIGYTIAGYLIHTNPPSLSLCLGAFLGGFGIMFLGTMYLTTGAGPFADQLIGGNILPVCLYAMGIFGLCCRLKGKIKPFAQKLLFVGGESSFCIYLIHMAFISVILHWRLSPDGLHPILSYPLLTLLVTAMSFAVYLILSRIPIVKKWLV